MQAVLALFNPADEGCGGSGSKGNDGDVMSLFDPRAERRDGCGCGGEGGCGCGSQEKGDVMALFNPGEACCGSCASGGGSFGPSRPPSTSDVAFMGDFADSQSIGPSRSYYVKYVEIEDPTPWKDLIKELKESLKDRFSPDDRPPWEGGERPTDLIDGKSCFGECLIAKPMWSMEKCCADCCPLVGEEGDPLSGARVTIDEDTSTPRCWCLYPEDLCGQRMPTPLPTKEDCPCPNDADPINCHWILGPGGGPCVADWDCPATPEPADFLPDCGEAICNCLPGYFPVDCHYQLIWDPSPPPGSLTCGPLIHGCAAMPVGQAGDPCNTCDPTCHPDACCIVNPVDPAGPCGCVWQGGCGCPGQPC